jgi:hypothetical protein
MTKKIQADFPEILTLKYTLEKNSSKSNLKSSKLYLKHNIQHPKSRMPAHQEILEAI